MGRQLVPTPEERERYRATNRASYARHAEKRRQEARDAWRAKSREEKDHSNKLHRDRYHMRGYAFDYDPSRFDPFNPPDQAVHPLVHFLLEVATRFGPSEANLAKETITVTTYLGTRAGLAAANAAISTFQEAAPDVGVDGCNVRTVKLSIVNGSFVGLEEGAVLYYQDLRVIRRRDGDRVRQILVDPIKGINDDSTAYLYQPPTWKPAP